MDLSTLSEDSSKVIKRVFASKLKEAMGSYTPTQLSRQLDQRLGISLSYQAISNYLKEESLPQSDMLYWLAVLF